MDTLKGVINLTLQTFIEVVNTDSISSSANPFTDVQVSVGVSKYSQSVFAVADQARGRDVTAN
mgnify:CR=1 FL=1